MSGLSTNAMMLAMLLDRVNQLEQLVARTPVVAPTVSQTNTVAPIVAPQQTNTVAPIVAPQQIQLDIEEEIEEDTSKMMGIGNGEQVAILARVSTPEQKASNRDSLGSQVDACTEQMRALGCKNATLIAQIDESASKDGKQLEQFFDNVLAFKKKPVIIVRTVSRFSRNIKIGTKRLDDIHNAEGRVIFGVSTDSTIVWHDTSTSLGRTTFYKQLEFADQWAQEMSATAKDNAKRKRQRAEEQTSNAKSKSKQTKTQHTDLTQTQRREHQIGIIRQVLLRNNRDSYDLRRIIDWIRIARHGGSSQDILGRLKDLISWKQWERNPKYTEWRVNPWDFPEGTTEQPNQAKPRELTFEWIAVNLKGWKIKMPPIRGLGNIQAGWSPELVELMYDVDGTESLTQLMRQL